MIVIRGVFYGNSIYSFRAFRLSIKSVPLSYQIPQNRTPNRNMTRKNNRKLGNNFSKYFLLSSFHEILLSFRLMVSLNKSKYSRINGQPTRIKCIKKRSATKRKTTFLIVKSISMQANDFRHFPIPFFLVPHGDELAGNGFGIGFFTVVKSMIAYLHDTVIVYGIHLHAFFQTLPSNLAANVLLGGSQQFLFGRHQTSFVVKKLDAVRINRRLGLHIAVVISIEKNLVHGQDFIE